MLVRNREDFTLDIEIPRLDIQRVSDRSCLFRALTLLREVKSPEPGVVSIHVVANSVILPEEKMMYGYGETREAAKASGLKILNPWVAVALILGPEPEHFKGCFMGVGPIRDWTDEGFQTLVFGQADDGEIFLHQESAELKYGRYPTARGIWAL